jgi:CHAT domain-containing protein
MTRILPGSRRASAGAVFLLALCLPPTLGCPTDSPHDGPPATSGEPRRVEPRLTGYTMWRRCTPKDSPEELVPNAKCGPTQPEPSDLVSIGRSNCRNGPADQRNSIRMLMHLPECTNAAIAKLELLATEHSDAKAWSDLSGAYYVRAQRYDQPSDLLRAFDAAEKAIAADSNLPEARFNYALTIEALGLNRDAIVAWQVVATEKDREWAAEGRARRDRLLRVTAIQATKAWTLNIKRLPDAARTGDTKTVQHLIAPYPAAAQRYVQSTVLPEWARALQRGTGAEAREHLVLASMIATALAQVTGDRYLLDGVESIERASRSGDSDALRALREGHVAYGQAWLQRQAFDNMRAVEQFKLASQLFASGGSPFALGASVNRIGFGDNDHVPAELNRIEVVARERRYGSLWATARFVRGTLLARQGRSLEALDVFDDATRERLQIGDYEGISTTSSWKIGLLQALGNSDMAFGEAFHAVRFASRTSDYGGRELVLSKAAHTALALDQPKAARRYQNEFIAMIESELMRTGPEASSTVGLRRTLAVAMSDRALIDLQLNDHDGAVQDLTRAEQLAGNDDTYADLRKGILARTHEVRAQTFLRTDPGKAIQLYTDAVAVIGDNYQAFLADLLLQRASAYGLVDNRKAELADLRLAVAAIGREENNLSTRSWPGENSLWVNAFSRYDRVLSRLIEQLASDGDTKGALRYAERKRLLSPRLLFARGGRNLSRETLTLALRELDVASIQRNIPSGTAIIEFTVLDDRTLIWLITRDRFATFVWLERRLTLTSLSRDLRQAMLERDQAAVESTLPRLFSGLLEAPLKALQGSPIGRLVIVADGALESIPFAALRNPTTNRYLVQDYSISVSDSATMYVSSVVSDRRRGDTAQASVLLVQTSTILPLREERDEFARLRALYPDAASLTGNKTTVRNFLRLARSSAIIQLAGNAIIDSGLSGETVLLFAPSETDSGVLPADELLKNGHLQQTRLVVLASCSTRANPLIDRSSSNIARMFVTAEVPAVLRRIGEVDDAATARLLDAFHRSYAAGEDAAAALRSAQLQLMATNDASYSSVFAWAPFELIGHASSPFERASR